MDKDQSSNPTCAQGEEEHSRPHAALNGVRVIDLSQFEAGTSCTQILGWLGADVLKVEEPTKGEQGRRSSRDRPDADSYYFMLLNSNKRSVTANLKEERGKELLRGLIKNADIFVENFAPGTIERLGFGYEDVRALNPRIIYAQIKGFAPDGPFGRFPAFDMIAQSAGGAVSITGEPDGRPLKPGVTLADAGTGLHCVAGILAALYQRQFTGQGQRVEVAMQEAVINLSRIAFARQLISGTAAPRVGNRSALGTNAPSETYPCKGGGPNDYCFIYTTRAGNSHWERLLKVIGREDLLDDPRFETPEARNKHCDELDSIISEWTRKYDKVEVMKTLGDAGVPAGAVFDTNELFHDPHLRKRGAFVTLKHPVRTEFTMPGWPVKMTDSDVPIVAAPLLGAHTSEVYEELLEIEANELEQLRKDKIV